MSQTVVMTALGQSRPITKGWPDGTIECPWCQYPIRATEIPCPNGYCDANPGWTPKRLAAHQATRAEKEAERERDERNRAWSMQSARERASEHEAWEDRVRQEARERGACLRCVIASGWEQARFIRHRGVCPKEAKR